ncbi:TnsA-like heteromeric transposase endonuclease subunit [Streptomyces sp. NPDC088817]|uniref:TnsA-like heteromeric transposase endonuclease subunit n=1 Tax=unclassified Streptomyces TaxID=2593676 RepID=UPI00382E8D95
MVDQLQLDLSAVTVSFRSDGGVQEDVRWAAVSGNSLGAARPWRTFRWYKGQQHYSGTYWASTNRDHVIYESRLELARLLYADFDGAVHRIVAQPFLIKANIGGKVRKHIPDYLLLSAGGLVVVDVKPLRRMSDPTVASTFAWTREVLESRGWRYEAWGEPPATELENLRFLAGYRRSWLINTDVLDELRAQDLDGATVGEAVRCLPNHPQPLVRASVLHFLWTGQLRTDLTRPLTANGVLWRSV